MWRQPRCLLSAMAVFWSSIFLFLILLAACKESPLDPARPGDPARGRSIYLASCIACHNSDPARDGVLGPAVKGASRDLLEARMMKAAYPPGYKPKRATANMPAYPYLKTALPDLAAYLR